MYIRHASVSDTDLSDAFSTPFPALVVTSSHPFPFPFHTFRFPFHPPPCLFVPVSPFLTSLCPILFVPFLFPVLSHSLSPRLPSFLFSLSFSPFIASHPSLPVSFIKEVRCPMMHSYFNLASGAYSKHQGRLNRGSRVSGCSPQLLGRGAVLSRKFVDVTDSRWWLFTSGSHQHSFVSALYQINTGDS